MHTHAWIAWVAMVMCLALTTTNPLYLGVLLLCVVLVFVVAPKTATGIAGFRALAVFGAVLLGLSMGIAVINGSPGSHVLFTVTGPRAPTWLGGLRIGGPVTGEGVVYNATRGLAVLCIFLAFGALNGAVSPQRVLRTAPAALFHAGLVVTVGLSLLPASVEDLRRVREMQALRGVSPGMRSLPGLIVPAVLGGLERSMRLAEAMEARGYAAAEPLGRGLRLAGGASAPLLLAAAYLWLWSDATRPYGLACAACSIGLLAVWLRGAARARRTTTLHVERPRLSDRALVAASALVAAGAIAARQAGWFGLGYDPFGGLSWPGFPAAGASLMLAACWPALVLLFFPARASIPGQRSLAKAAPP